MADRVTRWPDDGTALALLTVLLRGGSAADTDCRAESLPFAHLWSPLVGAAISLLPADLIAGQTHASLKQDLLRRLCCLGQEPLWEMFQQRRGAGASAIAALIPHSADVAPSDSLYRSFVTALADARLAPLLNRYPVLARLIPVTVAFWLANISEMLSRVRQDRTVLAAHFGIPETAVLAVIDPAAGDTHRRGRCVTVLTFRWDGQDRKLVYKPRDMRLEYAFQQLLSDPAAHGGLPPLAGVPTWRGDGYGYTAFIEHAVAGDALDLFYVNAGRLSALLYVLGFTDGHHENLVAQGPHLYVIDAETLLTPIPAAAYRPPRGADLLGAAAALWDDFDTSVARTELFPEWTVMGAGAVDTSAFGAVPATWPRDRPGWLHVNSDAMARGRQGHGAPAAGSLPVSPDHSAPFADNLGHFVAGFRQQSAVLIAQRADWLGADGLLARFNDCNGRAVLRGTRIYAALADGLVTAEALESDAAQNRTLDALKRLFDRTENPDALTDVARCERGQMAVRDIPVFAHRVAAPDLWGGTDRLVPNYFRAPGLQAARDRLRALSPAVISEQVGIIDGMVAARAQSLRTTMTGSGAVRTVQDIAADLIDSASPKGGWIGFDLLSDGARFAYRPLGMSLASGTLGIAVFLAAMDAARGRALALRIAEPLLRLAERGSPDAHSRWWRDTPSGLRGSGGQLLALHILAASRLEPQRMRQAIDHLIASLDPQAVAMPLDLWSGAAGLIGPLLLSGSDCALSKASVVADRLALCARGDLGTAKAQGFSHGLAGPLAALARAASVLGAARHGVAVDDLRQSGWQQADSDDWATGQAGLMVARLCIGEKARLPDSIPAELARTDLYRGWPGFVMAREIASRLPCAASAPSGDRRHLGLFTGVCGEGLARLTSPAAHRAKTLVLSAGLLSADSIPAD